MWGWEKKRGQFWNTEYPEKGGGVSPRGALRWSALEVLKAAQRKRATGSKERFRKGSRKVPRLPYFGSGHM